MDLMLPESGLLFWMTVIFAIVFFILARFGFPVITGMVGKRTERIERAISDARKAEESLSGLAMEQEKIIEKARAEQARILQEAFAEREQLVAEAKKQASDEAGRILEDARVKIRDEKEASLREIRTEVAGLSLMIAGEVLGKELSSDEGQQEFVRKMLDGTPGIPS